MRQNSVTMDGHAWVGQRARVAGPPTLGAVVAVGNEMLRHGLDGLLRGVPEVGAVHECGAPAELDDLLRRVRPDIVVIAAADGSWLEGRYRAIAAIGAAMLVMVDHSSLDGLGTYPSPPLASFLWQPSLTADELRGAVRHRGSGEVRMPPDLVRVLLERTAHEGKHARSRSVRLTGRERETVALLVKGLSNKQIARQLSISSHGAKRLVTSVMLKLDAPNRTLAAVTAVRAGIVPPE